MTAITMDRHNTLGVHVLPARAMLGLLTIYWTDTCVHVEGIPTDTCNETPRTSI